MALPLGFAPEVNLFNEDFSCRINNRQRITPANNHIPIGLKIIQPKNKFKNINVGKRHPVLPV